MDYSSWNAVGVAIPVILFEIGLGAFLYFAGKLLKHEEDQWGNPPAAEH